MEEQKWITRWRYELAAKPSKPGVWRRKEGGYLVRGRAVDCRTGKMREVLKPLDGVDANGAYRILQEELARIREGEVQTETARVRFNEYAASLFERLVAKRKIKSAKTKQLWELVLRLHLFPAFGDFFVDAIRKRDIEVWVAEQARKVAAGELSPTTVNIWLRMLRQILTEAVDDLDLEKNPTRKVENVDTSDHQTYTFEEPNSLDPNEVRAFLAAMKERHPHFFAITALGFATGLRPSSLRPLRRRGETPDVLWEEGVILVRQSQTIGDEVMQRTKQGTRYRIALPPELMDILLWHVDGLRRRREESDLLFPGRHGGFMSTTALDKPFKDVVEHLKLGKRFTPKGMRRTFQDLAREANIEGLVKRTICGHSTEEMTELYSTIRQGEIREAVGKVISLAGYRELVRPSASWCESGVKPTPTAEPSTPAAP